MVEAYYDISRGKIGIQQVLSRSVNSFRDVVIVVSTVRAILHSCSANVILILGFYFNNGFSSWLGKVSPTHELSNLHRKVTCVN